MTDILDVIKERRTVRKFLGKEIPKDVLDKILEAGNNAPSACDIQGWKFLIIKDRNIRESIVNNGAAAFIKDAPLCMFVLYKNTTDNLEYMDYIQSASASIQNMFLTAWTHKVGGCWVCHLPRKEQLRKILRIPLQYSPIACVVMGYYDKAPLPRPRKNELNEIIFVDRFSSKEKFGITDRIRLFFKRIGRKIYFLLPFRKYLKKTVDKKFEKKFD